MMTGPGVTTLESDGLIQVWFSPLGIGRERVDTGFELSMSDPNPLPCLMSSDHLFHAIPILVSYVLLAT